MNMSANKEVISILKRHGYPVDYLVHSDNKPTYFTFNFENEFGDDYGDDKPNNLIYAMQVHFFAPRTFNHLRIKEEVRNDLFNAGWTYPDVYTMYEPEGDYMHLIFTTEKEFYING